MNNKNTQISNMKLIENLLVLSILFALFCQILIQKAILPKYAAELIPAQKLLISAQNSAVSYVGSYETT